MSEQTIDYCHWMRDELDLAYHNEEWGVPLTNSEEVFTCLMLECQQAGLNWSIILHKRPALFEAFSNFDPVALSDYTDEQLEDLTENTEIIRHRGKIFAMRDNAQAYLELRESGVDLATWLWEQVDFTPQEPDNYLERKNKTSVNYFLARRIKDQLNEWGFKFIGETTIYAFLEAMGIINPHAPNCKRYKELKKIATPAKIKKDLKAQKHQKK